MRDGAAIEVFPGARAIAVGKDRFLPVKTTSELLRRSDVFELGEDARLRATSEIPGIDLDSRYYKLVDDFEARVPTSPSLRGARAFAVRGDWQIGMNVIVVGDVVLGPEGGQIPDGTMLNGSTPNL